MYVRMHAYSWYSVACERLALPLNVAAAPTTLSGYCRSLNNYPSYSSRFLVVAILQKTPSPILIL